MARISPQGTTISAVSHASAGAINTVDVTLVILSSKKHISDRGEPVVPPFMRRTKPRVVRGGTPDAMGHFYFAAMISVTTRE